MWTKTDIYKVVLAIVEGLATAEAEAVVEVVEVLQEVAGALPEEEEGAV